MGCTTYLTAPNQPVADNILSKDFCNDLVASHDLELLSTDISPYLNPKATTRSDDETAVASANEVYDDAFNEGSKFAASVTSINIWNTVLLDSNEALALIYDYSRLMYNNIVLPKKLYIKEGGHHKETGILVEQDALIQAEGEFLVTINPPSWRDFFKQPNKKPYEIQVADSMSAAHHSDKWNDGLKDGYNQGVCVAYHEYRQGLLRLKDDYLARYTYHVADKAGLVRPPQVRFVDMGIQVEGRTVKVGERIFKVTDQGDFEDSYEWGAINE